MNSWKTWASVLIFFAFVMGSATGGTPAEAAQHQMAAAGATVALVLLLAAVGCREVWRRTRHVTGQDGQGGPIPPTAAAQTADQRGLRAIWPRVRVYVGVAIFFAAVLSVLSVARAPTQAHCVVGVTGLAVSVSVDGPNALAHCQRFLQPPDAEGFYLYGSGVQPSGAVICRVLYEGDTMVVRAQDALTGSRICKAMIGDPAANP